MAKGGPQYSSVACYSSSLEQIQGCCSTANGIYGSQNASTFKATNPQGFAWFTANGTTLGPDVASCVAYASAATLLSCVKGNISDEHNYKCSSTTAASAGHSRLSTPVGLALLGLLAGTVLAL
ncbi:hypothetical protein Q8F55_007273 [Vanrija albida]|uniref:Ig-like domain-containing protein n=1 Tax=Vanrija albida TaxID=181172 RepID=A0ABR3PZV5_9TREE